MGKKKKDSDKKLRLDANEIAHRVMLEATGQKPKTPPPGEREDDEKDPEAVKRGKKGGKIGGRVRATKMSKSERQGAARDAAESRWRKSEDS